MHEIYTKFDSFPKSGPAGAMYYDIATANLYDYDDWIEGMFNKGFGPLLLENKLTVTKHDYNKINWNDLLYYDESSSTCLRWKVKRVGKGSAKTKYPNDEAGTIVRKKSSSDYVKITIPYNKKQYSSGRIIWILLNGSIDEILAVDHIDGNALNNKIDNLRLVSMQQNATNSKIKNNNRSGQTGVSFHTVNGYSYYEAACQYSKNGKKVRLRKLFSVLKLGEDAAFSLACQWRNAKLDELKVMGFDYTDRHGK